jgi:hypothetical protein
LADDLTPPRKLDRSALERVLARAAELQTTESAGDASGMLSEAEIIELGKEAGMSPEYLRQAIAEERTRSAAPVDSGLASTIIGPSFVRASRIVTGKPQELLDAIDGWMQRQESLQIKRRVAERIVWEPRGDLVAGIQRALNIRGRGYPLARAAEVAATTTPVDANRTLVALDASLTGHREKMVIQTAAVSGIGVAATAVGVVLAVAVPVAVIPAVIIPGPVLWLSRRMHASAVARGQLALEQLLDHLERGDHRQPGGLLGALASVAALRR